MGALQQNVRGWCGLQDEELQQPQTFLRRGSLQGKQSTVQTLQHLQVRVTLSHAPLLPGQVHQRRRLQGRAVSVRVLYRGAGGQEETWRGLDPF